MLKWVTQHGVAIIPKSENQKRLKENISLFDFEISKEDMKKLDTFDMGLRLCKPEFMNLEF